MNLDTLKSPSADVFRRTAASVIGVLLLASCGGGQSGSAPGASAPAASGISLLAGKPGLIADGTGPDASFAAIFGLGVDGAGNIYVSDLNVIRKIEAGTGVTTTIAGDPAIFANDDGVGRQAHFDFDLPAFAVSPEGISWRIGNNSRRIAPDGTVTRAPVDNSLFVVNRATTADAAGNIYFARSRRPPQVHGLPFNALSEILRVSPGGTVTTVASSNLDVAYSGLASSLGPDLYILRFGTEIQKVEAEGTMTPVHALTGFGQPQPTWLARDNAGNFFVTNDTTAIWMVQPDGVRRVFAGAEGVADFRDGKGTDAAFHNTGPLVIDAKGNLYVGDSGAVRRIGPDGTVTTVAGRPYWSDGKGAAARILSPGAVAVGGDGNVYFIDICRLGTKCVRKVDGQGNVTTIASEGSDSIPLGRVFTGLAAGEPGSVYALAGEAIYRITDAGAITVFAGVPGTYGFADGVGLAARFGNLIDAASDGAGNLYVTDRTAIRKVSAQGSVTTLAGQSGPAGMADGLGNQARFIAPRSIVMGPDDTLYLLDVDTIRRVSRDGVVTTLPGKFPWAKAIAVDSDKTIYLVRSSQPPSAGDTIVKLAADGTVVTVAGASGEYGIGAGGLPGKVGVVGGIARMAPKTFVAASPGGVFKIVLP
ncbi:hypothetical protein E4K72_02115 [Oxalobacteraceae bacterium OM1]|nr:hypothetical protein E4K72_02115 [Oxalobacteraceae bacterium OM1]